MLEEKTFYDLGENLNSKSHNQTFCELIPFSKFKGGSEVGKEYTLKANGKNLGEARVIAVHECKQEDVYSRSLPYMLMSLSSGETNIERLKDLPSEFFFVLFERTSQLQLEFTD